MKRAEALERFLVKAEEIFLPYNNAFWKALWDNRERVVSSVKDGLRKLAAQLDEHSKEVKYIYCFLLRYDLVNKRYLVYLQAVNEKYLFDPDPVESVINLDFIFENIDIYWSELIKDSNQYFWKINRYDVTDFVLKKIMEYNCKVAYVLRFMFRKSENQMEICKVLNKSLKIIRWGEYRDKGETIFYKDDMAKTSDDYIKLLDRSNKYPYMLQCTFLHNSNLINCDSRKKLMQFIVFKNCTFETVLFDETDLTGAFFFQCKFVNCSFQSTILKLVTFEQCEFWQTNWENAVFYGTFYKETEKNLLELTEEQKNHIVNEEKEFNEKIFFYGAG